jgi:hypothetical protein
LSVTESWIWGAGAGIGAPTLRAAIAGAALAGAADEVDSAATDMALSQVTLVPPITDPDKIICAGRNCGQQAFVIEPPSFNNPPCHRQAREHMPQHKFQTPVAAE